MKLQHDEAWLNGGQLLCLDSGMSLEHKQDVLLSSLYGQLLASAKSDKLGEVAQWFESYKRALRKLGWDMPRALEFSDRFPGNLTITWPDILKVLSRNGVPFSLDALMSIFQPGNGLVEPARSRFAKQTVSCLPDGSTPLCQVALLIGFGHSSPSMDVLLVHFRTRQPLAGDITQTVFESSQLEGQVHAIWMSACPDPWIYPDMREDVLDTLIGQTDQYWVRVDKGDGDAQP